MCPHLFIFIFLTEKFLIITSFPAVIPDSSFQVHMYVDSREKVTARYQVNQNSYIYTQTLRVPVVILLFLCLLLVDMPIKERSHGVWELQTEGHSFTKGSKGMGLAHSFVV